MSPIALRIEVSEVEGFAEPKNDFGNLRRDLSRHKGSPTARRFVVEKNTVREVHSVGLAVVHQDPECVLFRHGVWRTRIKGCRLGLRDLLDLSVELTGGGLVKPYSFFHAGGSNGIQKSEDTDTVGIGGILGHVEGHLDVAHGSEVVDFLWLNLGKNGNKVSGITEVTVVQVQFYSGLVTVLVEVIDAPGIETRRTTDDTVYYVSLFEQELS
mmetsp:Transcript_8555/g.17855  ORF Transcript_8555/g.17855 Transcript_8555/m.17855 type:complete len:212 (-) Transcript_8555:116-751(-)